MAKSKRSSAKKTITKKSTAKKPAGKSASGSRSISRNIPLVAAAPQTAAVAATVNITFTSGVGQATASLFRNGVLINMESISQSANILFSDVQSGDGVAIVGVSSGTTTIVISVGTSPRTPDHRPAGPIHRSYIIQ